VQYTFDTNVAIAAIRTRAERDRFNGFIRARRGQVLLHAVVWLELQLGARRREEQEALDDFVAPFVEAGRTQVPSLDAWRHAGRVLARLAARGEDVSRSSIHHDAILAASVREARMTLVTRNTADLARIGRHLTSLQYVAPYP
jgi:predicted nucleic acid-binding protein